MISEKKISKTELITNIPAYSKKLRSCLFIAPTDTIYGLSCNATNDELVKKLRLVKMTNQPLSIIAPSKDWILRNCVINETSQSWLNKLPGPYTLILELKNNSVVSKYVINKEQNSLGVRMPDHWFGDIVRKLRVPIVTTSANVSGRNFMTSLDNLDQEIKDSVDLIISVGLKKGRPSTLIHLVDKEKIIKR